MAKGLLKVILAAAVAAGAGLLVVHLLPGGDTPGRLTAALQVAVSGGVIMVVYLATAALLRVPEITQVVGMVRRKLGR
jgi:putative peptidoglycan lipid II flippase